MLGSVHKIPTSLIRELAEQANEQSETAINQAVANIRDAIKLWAPEVPVAKNPAKRLAQECLGSSLVVYAGPELGHAAYLWRRAFNRIAKMPAWQVNYPTDAEDDAVGWSGQAGVRPYTIIQLRTEQESSKVRDLFSSTNRLLSGKRPHAHTIEAHGATRFEQLLWTTVLGQSVATYIAIASGLDPADMTMSKKLKNRKVV